MRTHPVSAASWPRAVIAAYRDAYSGLPRGPWVLAAVCFVHRSGTMVLPFLALYLTAQRGLDAAQAGVVLSLYGLGSGVGAFAGGRATDSFGARRVQMASLGLAGLGFLVLGQLRSVAAIQGAVFLLACAAEAFRPANGAAFAAEVAPERWSQAFALRRLAVNLGMTCGPALGGLLAAHDYELLFVVDGSTCLLAAALLGLLDRTPAPPPPPAARLAGRSPWRDGPYLALLLAVAAFAAVLYQFFSTYPLALRDVQGFDEPRIGAVYAINTVLIVLCEMVLVQRLQRRRPLVIAAWGGLLFCVGFALMPFGRGYLWVAVTVAVWTLGEMLTMPFLETVAAARGDQRSRGSYLGSYNFAFSISFAGAPLLGAAVYQRYGPLPLFSACALLGVVLFFALRALAPRLTAGPGGAVVQPVASPAVAGSAPP